MAAVVKQETPDLERKPSLGVPPPVSALGEGSRRMNAAADLESTGKRSRTVPEPSEGGFSKKQRVERSNFPLPPGFLDPLPPVGRPEATPLSKAAAIAGKVMSPTPLSVVKPPSGAAVKSCKQFWKAGDYEGGGGNGGESGSHSTSMDHVRVHPKFLHSNATSHKWALGAFAELLDNSLDEICNGATYVNVDVLENKKEGGRMLLVEDNGGGMTPDNMRQCMSLGYSVKSKSANTIGQYGNGFKTSTMRLGADVIVFSRCQGKGASPTQSIGLLSYTFLRNTGKEDIVVPIVDYQKSGERWNKMIRSSVGDWERNLKTIVHWSPYASEEDLLQQFYSMGDQGTRIILYNLWEDDEGKLELDFEADQHDIQLRGVSRDEKKIIMAEKYPNSRHFLTYQHSLRSYASILYLRLPTGFRIVLRGKDVKHHNLVNDLMLTDKVTYKPLGVPDQMSKDPNMFADVTIGFVKDAKDHIDIQGFNVYHKNRLIKPFWRVWNAAGSGGRGVVGVLEANFVEPAHDKQGFERTIVLSRLEARLVVMQKKYWFKKAQKIGYAAGSKKSSSPVRGNPEEDNSCPNRGSPFSNKGKSSVRSNKANRKFSTNGSQKKSATKSENQSSCAKMFTDSSEELLGEDELGTVPHSANPSGRDSKASSQNGPQSLSNGKSRANGSSHIKPSDTRKDNSPENMSKEVLSKLEAENFELRERLKEIDNLGSADLRKDLQCERERCQVLETKLREAEEKIKALDAEQEAFINIFQEERERREQEELNLRKKLQDALKTIGELRNELEPLEKPYNC